MLRVTSSSNMPNIVIDSRSSAENQRKFQTESLRGVLYNWLVQNIESPTDASSIVLFILIVLLAWFIVSWIVKFIFSLFWPIIILAAFYLFLPHFQNTAIDKLLPKLMGTGKEVNIMGHNLYDIVNSIREAR